MKPCGFVSYIYIIVVNNQHLSVGVTWLHHQPSSPHPEKVGPSSTRDVSTGRRWFFVRLRGGKMSISRCDTKRARSRAVTTRSGHDSVRKEAVREVGQLPNLGARLVTRCRIRFGVLDGFHRASHRRVVETRDIAFEYATAFHSP